MIRRKLLRHHLAAALGLTLAATSLAATSLTGTALAAPPAPGTASGSVASAAATDTAAAAATDPVTRERRIIENVHTDAVSVFVDDGQLVLGSKADINGQTGYRIDTDSTVFYLDAAARTATADAPDFLRRLGSEMWLAPQTQNPALIWPGFSTEHDPLVEASDDQRVQLELIDTKGPGRVELFLTELGSAQRVFSSSERLPAWSMGMRQHTHMNWAFATPGRYELTFRATARINGKQQRAERTYSFYVGARSQLTSGTGMLVAASSGELEPGEPFTLRAEFDPASARGWVEYADATTGQVLGHSPVRGGVATLTTRALNPGKHEITARFIPTWADEYRPVVLPEGKGLPILVTGEATERPKHRDDRAVTDASLTNARRGTTVTVPGNSKRVDQHATVTAAALKLAGEWVSVWQHGGGTARWLGWVQVAADGNLTVRIANAKPGAAKLVLKSVDGELLGWDSFTIAKLQVRPGELPQPPKQSRPATPGGAAGRPRTQPSAPGQRCEPSLVLDSGHVDAFNVSASSGGQAALQLKEDVTGSHVLHEAEDVLLRVNESAHEANIPASLPGAPAGYVLPLAQRGDLVWPGWDTNRTAGSGYTDVTITIHSVEGPGTVDLYSLGSFGELKLLLNGGATRLPGSVREPQPAHTHAQWVFSKAGIYVLTVSATATNPQTGKSATTATHRYVFQVGDAPLGDVFCKVTASADSRAASAAVNEDVAEQEAKAAEAAKQARAKEKEKARRRAERAAAATESDAPATAASGPATANAERDTLLVGGVIGVGGALMIGGIAYGTRWYLRRLHGLDAGSTDAL